MSQIAPTIVRLRDLTRPPEQLYYQGNWDKTLFAKCAAVVGSRRITQYGRMVVEKLVPQLVQDGFTIVSGFMYGVDQAAHRQCLDSGGKTIAVLGWGINWDGLDGEDKKLLTEIAKNGLVISEWEEQKPTLWTFPQRNRIVAAIAHDLFVVEAAQKSGALITAEIAKRLKREIWAVPGPVTSKTSEGTNRLIADGTARMWLPGEVKKTNKPITHPILEVLSREPAHASDIARTLGKPIDTVGAELSLLVLSGEIMEREGLYYVG